MGGVSFFLTVLCSIQELQFPRLFHAIFLPKVPSMNFGPEEKSEWDEIFVFRILE